MAVVSSAIVHAVTAQAAGVPAGLKGGVQPTDNSMPGMGAFLVFVFLAVALYFLLKNMNARMRRMSYREREREAAEAAEREAEQAADPQSIDLRDPHREFGASEELGPVEPEAGSADSEVEDGESGEPHTGSR